MGGGSSEVLGPPGCGNLTDWRVHHDTSEGHFELPRALILLGVLDTTEAHSVVTLPLLRSPQGLSGTRRQGHKPSRDGGGIVQQRN